MKNRCQKWSYTKSNFSQNIKASFNKGRCFPLSLNHNHSNVALMPIWDLREKDIKTAFKKEHDFLRNFNFPPFSSVLRRTKGKSGKFKSRKNRVLQSCSSANAVVVLFVKAVFYHKKPQIKPLQCFKWISCLNSSQNHTPIWFHGMEK